MPKAANYITPAHPIPIRYGASAEVCPDLA